MDPLKPQRQQPPEPGYSPYPPLPPAPDTDRPFYNAPPPGSSALPYRPGPVADAPEGGNYYHPPMPPDATMSYPPPPAIHIPPQASPTASAPASSYTGKPPQPLNHLSPRPITDPVPGGSVRFDPAVTGRPANTPTYYPPPPNSTTMATTTHDNSSGNTTLGEARASAQSALRELLAARRQHAMVSGPGAAGKVNGGYAGPQGEVEERVRRQTGLVVQGLRGLRARVGELGEGAEGERWRRVVVGTVVASFIPLVKRLFRRPTDEAHESTNRTEYAFRRSRSLVSRILALTHRPGLGTLAFFVFAVLYVFQNEVALRVAKTVARRLKRLQARIEDGRDELSEDDVGLLQGWRWRILAWSE